MSEEKKIIDRINRSYDDNTQYVEASAKDWNCIVHLIRNQQKEIEELKKDKKDNIQVVYGGRRFGTEGMVVKDYISKDKIRDYFAHDIAFKRRLIREKEEISDYNRGKFDTIEDLLERLEDNKWN